MAEREAPGDFGYLWDDPADEDGLTSHDHDVQSQRAEELEHPPSDPGADLWDEPDDNFWDNQPEVRDVEDTGHFDAFNVNTWRFKPAPTAWYRTRQAATVIVAASAAVAETIKTASRSAGFTPKTPVIEISGVCAHCKAA